MIPRFQIVLAILSWLIVSFGQPAMSEWLGLIAASCGYAIFCRVLLCHSSRKARFFIGTLWFASVQLVQLYWLISHPYLYIYAVYVLLAILFGLQFGFLSIFITPKNLSRYSSIISIAAAWTLLEWSRLYYFSGFSWNPTGLALTGNLYSLQFASFAGIYGLTFWVIFINLSCLKAWVEGFKSSQTILWISLCLTPYLYGLIQIESHATSFKDDPNRLQIVLLHTHFLTTEDNSYLDKRNTISHVMDQWGQLLEPLKQHQGSKLDLIVLPEYVVLCGTYSCVFPYEKVTQLFQDKFGPNITAAFPPHSPVFSRAIYSNEGTPVYFVNNAFLGQTLSNHFNAGVLIGLEDAEDNQEGVREYYSTAQYFQPYRYDTIPHRYDKRILLPLGEYIPFSWCRSLAANYGVLGSFTQGKEAKVFTANRTPFSVSICYEETFGELMLEGRQKGAELLVNMTSDVWYPYSLLAYQHFTHAKVRTVEAGIPLIRASNVGISGAVDSFGREIRLEQESSDEGDHRALKVEVPLYHYQTPYTLFGDKFIVVACIFAICFNVILQQRSQREMEKIGEKTS